MTAALALMFFVIAFLVVVRIYLLGDTAARSFARAEHQEIAVSEPESVLAKLSVDEYVELFEAMRHRRFWIYFAIFIGMAAGAITVFMALIAALHRFIDPGFYVLGFLTFFGLIAVALVCVAYTLHLYVSKRREAMALAATRLRRS